MFVALCRRPRRGRQAAATRHLWLLCLRLPGPSRPEANGPPPSLRPARILARPPSAHRMSSPRRSLLQDREAPRARPPATHSSRGATVDRALPVMSESPLSEYDVPWWLRTRPNRSVALNQPSHLLSLLIKPLQQDFAYLRSIGGDPLATSPSHQRICHESRHIIVDLR
jgi:hypothetical protein